MAKLNQKVANPNRSRGALASTTKTTKTHEGGQGFGFDVKSELFLTAVSSFYGEKSFYESAADRNERFEKLCADAAVLDPDWYLNFVTWLRGDGNIRTAAIVAAAVGADAQLKAGKTGVRVAGVRPLVQAPLQRADEPGEFIAFWRANLRNSLPGGVQRGLQDAIVRLYSEFSALKYDTAGRGGYRFGDVITLVRPDSLGYRDVFYKWLLNRRKHADEPVPEELRMVIAREALLKRLATERDAVLTDSSVSELLREAGLTWENLAGTGKMDKAAWEAMIPSMGYMALLRNLRNFDDAGLSAKAKAAVANRLADPAQVAKSRQLPYRFLSAHLEAQGHVWQDALEHALTYSVKNIPVLGGMTVVLVDTSASMSNVGYSAKSKITPVMAGALFACALASKNAGAKLFGFADGHNVFEHRVSEGMAVLRETERFCNRIGEDGHGTEVAASLRKAFARYPDAARFVIVSDMQTAGLAVGGGIPQSTPLYAFNMGGYGNTSMQSTATRHQLGGLTDATFRMIQALEAGQRGVWPWENQG